MNCLFYLKFWKCLILEHRMKYGHKLWFANISVPHGKSGLSAVKWFMSFLTSDTYFQSFVRVNLPVTWMLFLSSCWQASMNSGAMVQPTFWKIDSTFTFRCSSSTWQGIPSTSTYSFLKCWTFAHHWGSNVTICFVSSVLTCLAIASSDSD